MPPWQRSQREDAGKPAPCPARPRLGRKIEPVTTPGAPTGCGKVIRAHTLQGSGIIQQLIGPDLVCSFYPIRDDAGGNLQLHRGRSAQRLYVRPSWRSTGEVVSHGGRLAISPTPKQQNHTIRRKFRRSTSSRRQMQPGSKWRSAGRHFGTAIDPGCIRRTRPLGFNAN